MRFAHQRRPVDNRKRLPTVRRLCPQGPPAYPLHVDNALRAPARRAFAHIQLSQLSIWTIRNQSVCIDGAYPDLDAHPEGYLASSPERTIWPYVSMAF